MTNLFSRSLVLLLPLFLLCTACDASSGKQESLPSHPVDSSSASSMEEAAEGPAPSLATSSSEASPAPSPSSYPVTDRDLTSPDSLTLLVNKQHPLNPLDYAPSDLVSWRGVELRQPAAQAAEQLVQAAASQGIELQVLSGYRSYQTQVGTYSYWQQTYGQEQADVASARPGYSEHQTGLALDLGDGSGCNLQPCFAQTPAGRWLAEQAADYGFVIRYPWWQHETTGYWYESWHLRYIGPDEAAAYRQSGAESLEDFWGAGPAPHYN